MTQRRVWVLAMRGVSTMATRTRGRGGRKMRTVMKSVVAVMVQWGARRTMTSVWEAWTSFFEAVEGALWRFIAE